MMKTTHPLVDDYLRRFEHSARVLPRSEQKELVGSIRDHLDAAIAPDATEADVRNVLDDLGEPADIVAAAQPGRAPARRGAREAFAGAGIQLVTVWQSKAQLDQIYGRDAETVLTNHRSKLIYPSSLSDLSTVQYISDLVGDEHVRSDLDKRSSWMANQSGRRGAAREPRCRSYRRTACAEPKWATPCSFTAAFRPLGYRPKGVPREGVEPARAVTT